MNDYQDTKDVIIKALKNDRLPHAMLLIGSFGWTIKSFVSELLPIFTCPHPNSPCLTCPDCRMALNNEHPDVEWVLPEKEGASIKIDQIRALQSSAYMTSQRAPYKIIIIDEADRMNNAASNALLKLLEEPAVHTKIILIAHRISTLLPTIVSRCQTFQLKIKECEAEDNLLALAANYPGSTARTVLMAQAESLLDDLITVLQGTTHPSTLASRWSQFELSHLLWFLYLTYAQLQYMHQGKNQILGVGQNQLEQLVILTTPMSIFGQIEKINVLLKKMSHNINVNQVLALEDLLFCLLQSP